MKCIHNWEVINQKKYIDYSGYRVLKLKRKCDRCNKIKTQKYY